MKKTAWKISLILFLLIGIGGTVSWLHKTVRIAADGEVITLASFSLRVQDALQNAQVHLYQGDQTKPALAEWLAEGMQIEVLRARQVQILADQQTISLLTIEQDPAHLLAQAGLTWTEHDRLLVDGYASSFDQAPAGSSPTRRAVSLQLLRANTVRLHQGEQVTTIHSAAATLGQALWEAGIVLHTADHLEPPPETPLQEDMQATLERARPLAIGINEKSYSVYTAAATVGEALSQAGIGLVGLDYSIPEESAPLPEDGQVRLVRVTEQVLIEQTPLPFENTYAPVSDLEIDQQKIMETGEYGLKARRVRIRFEDGQEISRQVEDEWVARQPKNQVTGYGTLVMPHTLDTPDGPITYWRALRMWAASYYPKASGGDITASGMKLKKGVAAVDTDLIPFYTQLYIPGYGQAVAADRGRLVKGRVIDLGYSDDDYVSWHQYVTVYFLWPPPAQIVYIIP